MSALSIRNMNHTLAQMEYIRARKAAGWYASLPAEEKADRSHYWFVERKSKRNKKEWIFVRDLFATKREAADLFVKHFSGGGYRLRHIMSY
jgi:hypothetical protein